MWTNRDYEELQTLEEYISTHSGSIFPVNTFDDATKTSVTEWFKYRRVCDNDRFGSYFKRKCSLLGKQYNAYLKIESTEFDPLVISYFESQDKNTVKNTGESNVADNRTIEGTDGSTSLTEGENAGTSKTTRSGSGTESGTSVTDGDRLTKGKITGNGSDTEEGTNVTDGETNRNTTRETETSGTSQSTLTHNTTVTTDGTSNNKSLHGETPASQIGTQGMPAALDWQYLSNQDETSETNHGTNATTGTERTDGTEEGDVSETVGEKVTNDTTITNTVNKTSSKTENNEISETNDVTVTNNVTKSDSETINGEESGTNKTQTTISGNNKTETEGTTKTTQSGNVEGNHATRSKTSGNAPELLELAKSFVLNTNAFKWLIRELEPCFMMIYEE